MLAERRRAALLSVRSKQDIVSLNARGLPTPSPSSKEQVSLTHFYSSELATSSRLHKDIGNIPSSSACILLISAVPSASSTTSVEPLTLVIESSCVGECVAGEDSVSFTLCGPSLPDGNLSPVHTGEATLSVSSSSRRPCRQATMQPMASAAELAEEVVILLLLWLLSCKTSLSRCLGCCKRVREGGRQRKTSADCVPRHRRGSTLDSLPPNGHYATGSQSIKGGILLERDASCRPRSTVYGSRMTATKSLQRKEYESLRMVAGSIQKQFEVSPYILRMQESICLRSQTQIQQVCSETPGHHARYANIQILPFFKARTPHHLHRSRAELNTHHRTPRPHSPHIAPCLASPSTAPGEQPSSPPPPPSTSRPYPGGCCSSVDT